MIAGIRASSLLILLVAPTFAAASSAPGNPLEGRRTIYTKGCLECHSIRSSGGSLGPDLGRLGKGRTFFQLAGLFLGHSPKMIDTMIDKGIEWPELSPEEMENLFSYLYYMNYLDLPGDYDRGRETFASKGCGDCHSLDEKGGDIGPELDRIARYMSPVLLAQLMWNKAPEMTRQMRALGKPVPRLEGGELADILAYIRGTTNQGYADRVYLPPGDPELGREIFAQKQCLHCHAAEDVEIQGGAPDLKREGLDLSVSAVAAVLWNHASEMKTSMDEEGIVFPRFEGAELAHLLAHLYYLSYFDDSGDAQRGGEVFTQKGCVGCHGESDLAVDLRSDEGILASPFHFVSAMWNHLPTMKEAAEEGHVLLWPAFQQDEMRDLFAYLRRSSTQASQESR